MRRSALAVCVVSLAILGVGLIVGPLSDDQDDAVDAVGKVSTVAQHDPVSPTAMKDRYYEMIEAGRRWCREKRAFEAAVKAGLHPIDTTAPSDQRQFESVAAQYNKERPWVTKPVDLPKRAPTLQKVMADCPAPPPIDRVGEDGGNLPAGRNHGARPES
ncbi:MAG: hypothetical protein ACSLFR_17820 [Solirubrobacteraceae bacterium]